MSIFMNSKLPEGIKPENLDTMSHYGAIKRKMKKDYDLDLSKIPTNTTRTVSSKPIVLQKQLDRLTQRIVSNAIKFIFRWIAKIATMLFFRATASAVPIVSGASICAISNTACSMNNIPRMNILKNSKQLILVPLQRFEK